MSLSENIKQKAIELGFELVGITDASPIEAEHIEHLSRWLKAGLAGEMSYMHRNLEKRTNPAKLLENGHSVICVALNYTPQKQKPKSSEPIIPIGRVANYAQYEDYHLFIKRRLRKLINFISSIAGADHKFKICVDSAPLAERALAGRAGLGFIGKNHMLINPALGPQIFLGEILTDLKLQTDEPVPCHSKPAPANEELIDTTTTQCANCNKCIAACPTGALRPDGQFDSNKCISYLTTQYKGRIHPSLAEKIGDRLFGCDECVLACPYQQNAPVCKNEHFKFYNDRAEFDLHQILSWTQEQFEAMFADSTIKRLGLERLKRNAQICLGNYNYT